MNMKRRQVDDAFDNAFAHVKLKQIFTQLIIGEQSFIIILIGSRIMKCFKTDPIRFNPYLKYSHGWYDE